MDDSNAGASFPEGADQPVQAAPQPPLQITARKRSAILIPIIIFVIVIIGAAGFFYYSGLTKTPLTTITSSESTTTISTSTTASTTTTSAQSNIIGYFYCVGPFTTSHINGNAFSYAPIHTDGSLGPWVSNFSYLSPLLMETSCTASGGNMYCIGGFLHSNTYTNAVKYSTLSSELTPWSSTIPYPLIGITQCTNYNDYIYCIGSYNAFRILSGNYSGYTSVYYAHAMTNGTEAWKYANAYPRNYTSPICTAVSGSLYCIGGFNYKSLVTNDTYYSHINSNGSIGNWIATTPYPIKTSSISCTGYGSNIYCIGGNETNSSYYVPILLGGGLGTWRVTTPYPFRVSYLSCSAFNGYIYCNGGINASGGVLNTTYYSAINPDGSLGKWNETLPFPTKELGLPVSHCAATSA